MAQIAVITDEQIARIAEAAARKVLAHHIEPEVWTVEETAEFLKVHQNTIYTMLAKNQIPHFRVGKQYRFSPAAVKTWLKQQTVNR